MVGREDRVAEEAEALWRTVFGEAPPARADPATLLDVILHSLGERSYERLARPHLNDAGLTWPRPSLPLR
jgi:hypothetical protein